MSQTLINCPSLANSSIFELADDVNRFREAGVSWFHIDIMDGHYVPNICFPVRMVSDLKQFYPEAVTDIHLMVTDPDSYILPLKEAGVDYLSFHTDSTNFVLRTIKHIKDAGMKAGVVLNPSQRVDVLTPYIDKVDYVVLMAVEPGFAGQQFMTETLPRLEELSKLREECGNDFLISIDGAINMPNVQPCVKRGANIFITGIYSVYRQEGGIVKACARFEEEMRKGLESE